MEVLKEYNIAEPKLIELAKRYTALIKRFIKPLSDLNSNLSDDFLTSLTDDLVLLDTIPDGKSSDEILKQRKQDVNDVKQECVKYFKKVHYFVIEAFQEDTTVIDSFGFNDLSANIKTSTGLITFLSEFQMNCLVYWDELVEAGFTQAYLDEIDDLRNRVVVKASELLKLRKNPQKYTDLRVSILNRIWHKIKSVHRAAHLIFDTDDTILKEFKIPETPLAKFSKRFLSIFHIGSY